MAKPIDVTGDTYGRLTAVRRETDGLWLFRCECGAEKALSLARVRHGGTRSCGCLKVETLAKRSTKHGEGRRGQKTAEYRTWVKMRDRCNNPRNFRYSLYGGRGIAVCERWSDYEAFVADMGRRPSPKHSIDRIDVNGGYGPGNCRWVTQMEQMNNVRKNIRIEFEGTRQTLSQWARHFGWKPDFLKGRYYRGDRPPELFRPVDGAYWGGRVAAALAREAAA